MDLVYGPGLYSTWYAKNTVLLRVEERVVVLRLFLLAPVDRLFEELRLWGVGPLRPALQGEVQYSTRKERGREVRKVNKWESDYPTSM